MIFHVQKGQGIKKNFQGDSTSPLLFIQISFKYILWKCKITGKGNYFMDDLKTIK